MVLETLRQGTNRAPRHFSAHGNLFLPPCQALLESHEPHWFCWCNVGSIPAAALSNACAPCASSHVWFCLISLGTRQGKDRKQMLC